MTTSACGFLRSGIAGLALIAVTPVLAGPAEDDFQRRATSSGVIRAVSFDTAAEVTGNVHPDGSFERSGSGFDTQVKASGGGALRFNVPGLTSAGAGGSWRINFSAARDALIGEGQDVYIQWRQRFDEPFVNTRFAGSGGWKQVIIGEGEVPGGPEVNSCTQLEVVVQNTNLRGYSQMYHNCGRYQGFNERFGEYDYKLQNKMPEPFCLYSDSSGCFKYYPNEWMTFQVHIRPGPRGTAYSTLERQDVTGFTNSVVELWIAREGQPSVLALSWSGVVLRETHGANYGKIWLLPYQTGKDASVDHPLARTWYDELIISRSKIPDPGVASGPTPNPPTNVRTN